LASRIRSAVVALVGLAAVVAVEMPSEGEVEANAGLPLLRVRHRECPTAE
jgi:hypothetical protein